MFIIDSAILITQKFSLPARGLPARFMNNRGPIDLSNFCRSLSGRFISEKETGETTLSATLAGVDSGVSNPSDPSCLELPRKFDLPAISESNWWEFNNSLTNLNWSEATTSYSTRFFRRNAPLIILKKAETVTVSFFRDEPNHDRSICPPFPSTRSRTHTSTMSSITPRELSWFTKPFVWYMVPNFAWIERQSENSAMRI